VVAKAAAAAGGSLEGVTVTAWGLTFKAGTDDRRNSPAMQVAARMIELGALIRAYDPTVDPSPAVRDKDLGGIELCADPYEACRGAAVAVVLTEWDEFRWLDFSRVMSVMRQPSIVDARNLLDPAAVRRMGFAYTGIGRR
jgi:UDPglucose 6-dehydrogenase